MFHCYQVVGQDYAVTNHCLQVYNERIYDLLHEGIPPLEGWKPLELKEDAHGCVFVEGLCKVSCSHCCVSYTKVPQFH